MMVASQQLDRLSNASKCVISTLFPYFLLMAMVDPYSLFKLIIGCYDLLHGIVMMSLIWMCSFYGSGQKKVNVL